MNRKTWETVNASIVEAMPKSTSKVIHPDDRRVDVAGSGTADICQRTIGFITSELPGCSLRGHSTDDLTTKRLESVSSDAAAW